MNPPPERSSSATSTADAPPVPVPKTRRVLACMQCQQRKVKCDRTFPCSTCVRSHSQCVPAASLPPRPRRKRFPERDLLDRLHRYETLLRQNDIKFEPLHNESSTASKTARLLGRCDLDIEHLGAERTQDGSASPSGSTKGESVYKAKNLWHAMNQRSPDSDDDSSDSELSDVQGAIRLAWEEHASGDNLFFGSRRMAVDLPSLHPGQAHIFKLWQVYIDNVNPLLKVTHSPTLQNRIIDAASNLSSVKPAFAALMFSIYCVSVLSLDDEECCAMFEERREHLLSRYQQACQQALLNCGFLRSSDRESLTALYLYLISATSSADPPSLSCMLSLAIRLAQRIGLHSESAYTKASPFEAEMRRRLWWSLALFDTRMCELSDNTCVMLVPTWDCKIPLNVGDLDLRPEMKESPPVTGQSTESLFAVVRCEIGNYVRHSPIHLDFTIPALKAVAKDVESGAIAELSKFEKVIEEKYLKACNPENPIHFVTLWTARGYLAKSRLMQFYTKSPSPLTQEADAQRDVAASIALEMLDCDTKLMTSPLTKGYLWHINMFFPFPAYIHLVHDLKKRPASLHAAKAWETMSDHYEARGMHRGSKYNHFFRVFAKTHILSAWEIRSALDIQSDKVQAPPRIVSHVRQTVAQAMKESHSQQEDLNELWGTAFEDLSGLMPMDSGIYNTLSGLGVHGFEDSAMGHGHDAFDTAGQVDWNAMDWNSANARGW